MNDLKSRWFDSIDKSCPLPEYPRPQLVRENWLCLNGEYDYSITGAEAECPKVFLFRLNLLHQALTNLFFPIKDSGTAENLHLPMNSTAKELFFISMRLTGNAQYG